MQLGRLLLAVQHAPTSLERMLAVGRLCLIFLTDLMRRSNDSQDIPLLILGHHYMSHRILSECGRLLLSSASSCVTVHCNKASQVQEQCTQLNEPTSPSAAHGAEEHNMLCM